MGGRSGLPLLAGIGNIAVATHISKHFKQRRIELGLSLGQLAELCDYTNLSKGANRIATFERTGNAHHDLFRKMAAALEIDSATVRRFAAEDHREWKQWADTPVKPRLVVRLLACVYNPWPLPDHIKTQEQAEEHAAQIARTQRRKVALIWSRRLTAYFDEDGQKSSTEEAKPGEPNSPWVQIGGKRISY